MKRKQKQIHYWIMVIPALLWLVLINIVPMGGIVMACLLYTSDAADEL